MRVLIINTSERVGGAAIAANRLMEALKRNGVKTKMLVRDKQTDRLTVVAVGQRWTQPVNFLWERLCIFIANRFSRKNLFQIDIANAGTDITRLPAFQEADVIHLHWINQGFLSLSNIDRILQSGKPVVITMHDQWYFTGICHYSGDCQKYRELCHHCELMNGTLLGDLAKQRFLRKADIYRNAQLTFVGCSQWMAELAKTSKLTQGHRVVSIPNAINTELFRPQDKQQARASFHLPTDKHLLLFGCQRITDERKGFCYLKAACEHLAHSAPALAAQLGVVVLGGDAQAVKSSLPLPVYTVDYLSDEHEIASLYNAVDLFVTPSLQDNLPNTIVEAMACGTPCVGFDVGGIPEMIVHRQDGYVAISKDSHDLARGIVWCLDYSRLDALSQAARDHALATYSEPIAARNYQDIYRSLL